MRTVDVPTSSRAYQVVVGRDVLGELGGLARQAAGGTKAMVVSDTNVAPLYGTAVRASLAAAGYEVGEAAFPAGEASKTLETLGWLLGRIAEAGLGRDDVVVALGGGVVGDVAGLAAATYMRGIRVVQVPTSLLAMVDSSVGGKTAVDLPAGKNLVGAFWQPSLVLADVACLRTLSPGLFRDSVGEVIKYGVLCDPELFCSLEARPLDGSDLARVEDVVVRNVEAKRDIVVADEREGGIRQTLNLGHTIGHAIEAESGYRLGHGSCVAAGLAMMARANAAEGLCAPEVAARIRSVVAAHGLPCGCDVPVEVLYRRSLADKKRHADALNLVVVRDIGRVEVRRTPLAAYRRILELARA